jgi:hypothetical protein
MHLLVASLAVVFLIAGFVGFAAGGLPTIVLWFLAAACVVLSWKMRPPSQGAPEERASERQPPP